MLLYGIKFPLRFSITTFFVGKCRRSAVRVHGHIDHITIAANFCLNQISPVIIDCHPDFIPEHYDGITISGCDYFLGWSVKR